MEDTDSLRELAPQWSLAGDERLLGLLQNTHQRIVSKCREVNSKLDEMATALDSASINLQNVNNRFMALSNSQFIESRVYDDDADVTTVTKPVEETKTEDLPDELTLLKQSLAVLDGAHELTEILDDSDTDDSDAQISVVLQPRDAYQHRPLPYIIGSQAWKSKWHAGLLLEESDSDSSVSKRGAVEEYSESEDDVQVQKLPADAAISESSFSLQSDRSPPEQQTPAEVAAELAARLGNAPLTVLEEPEDGPQSTPKHVYRPQKPVSSTIFSDEPPPLDYQDSEDEDIFAEINKKQPYNNNDTSHSRLTDDLFGNRMDYEEQRIVTQKPTLFDDDSEPELFNNSQTLPKDSSRSKPQENLKKPVGGISLLGSNKGAESIGAAILKRNQRKSISSESDDDSKNVTPEDYVDANSANYIFDNLFAKAKAEQKMAKQADRPIKEKPKQKLKIVKEITKKPEPNEVKDLFSDNIFDDIDDIFTSNIKIPTKDASKKAKSIFDDDDLFSDIAQTPKETVKDKAISNKKSIFDNDDDLFSDVKTQDKYEKPKELKTESQISKETNNNTTKITKETSMFDDSKGKESNIKPKAKSKSIFDSDTDDDLFSDVKVKTKTEKVESKSKLSDTESELFKEKKTDLFKKKETISVANTLKTEMNKVFQSPSLFEEDEIDDLFINANKAKISEDNAVEHKIPENLPVIDKNEWTEESLDNVKGDGKSDIAQENKEKVIENQNPVVVDTKSYTFPNIDINDSGENGSKLNNTNVNENIKESSPDVQKIDSIGTEINAGKAKENINVEIKNDDKESLLPETQELFSGTSQEMPESTVNDDKKDESKEKQDVLTQQKNEIPIATFEDIITEPPAFEKTKESKKTVNVNALFEDDSDDEALFFKKNDVISDEKPDVFTPSANFGIFNDEPPAFDVLTSKSNKNDDLFSSISKDDSAKKSEDEWNDDLNDKSVPKFNDNDIFGSQETNVDTKTKKTDNTALSKDIPDSDEELFSSINKNNPIPESESNKNSIDQLDDVKQDRKIGKLNTKNFNINVQALVPGASPKKIPKDLNEDTKIAKDDLTPKEIESIITRDIDPVAEPTDITVSFENKPASGVLDNNLSKQRPRIQVKRRPSSRKARLEAVRKSVIDLDDDTDNSSSFDEPLPKLIQNKFPKHSDLKAKDNLTDDLNSLESDSNISTEPYGRKNQDQIPKVTDNIFDDLGSFEPESAKKDKSKESLDNKDNHLKTSTIDQLLQEPVAKNVNSAITDEESGIKSVKHKNNVTEPNDEKTTPKIKKDVTFKQEEINENVTKVDTNVKTNEAKESNEENQSTTKVKYILNDEDIFTKTNDSFLKNTESDDDMFKTKGVKTIGNTYKEPKPDPVKSKESKSVFDLSDDEDLFGKGVKSKKVEPKSKLFDSDSEDDLFTGKKKIKETNAFKKVKEVKVGGSLFGDDDDDLFATSKKTSIVPTKPSVSTSRSATKDTKPTEVVFDDPLSMLDD